jgi:hypothetical protein
MLVVVLGAFCYGFALSSFDRNAFDKKCVDDPSFRGFLGDV